MAQILKMMPVPPTPPNGQGPANGKDDGGRERLRGGDGDSYSERLDPPISEMLRGGYSKAGPILDKSGKPLKPFTLLNQRQELANGVFKPGHNLPSMTIDEYLEAEKKRGGIINGGGEASMQQGNGVVDEDDMALADRETMKAREWDEFVEANPKGSGNTINRG